MTIYGYKIRIKILPKISVTYFFQKVFWVLKNGQKKMSKIENPKKVLKKTLFFRVSEHNALIFVFWMKKSVTINFYIFLQKMI